MRCDECGDESVEPGQMLIHVGNLYLCHECAVALSKSFTDEEEE